MSATTSRRTWHLLLAIACVGTAGGCGRDELFPAPSCDGGSAMLVEAQSVPGASQVACLDRLPEGWTVAFVRIDQDGMTIRLDSDRAGAGAAVLRFGPACDVTDAVRVSSNLPAAARFDRIEQLVPRFRSSRSYVFPGGCVRWQFDFDAGVTATESVAIGDTLQLVARADLQRGVSDGFVDEEL